MLETSESATQRPLVKKKQPKRKENTGAENRKAFNRRPVGLCVVEMGPHFTKFGASWSNGWRFRVRVLISLLALGLARTSLEFLRVKNDGRAFVSRHGM